MKTELSQKLEEALNEMPPVFSSREFAVMVKNKGIPKTFVDNGGMRDFLKNECKNHNGKRTWVKKTVISIKKHIQPEIFDDIDHAISLLKSNGYLIQKPVTEWTEI